MTYLISNSSVVERQREVKTEASGCGVKHHGQTSVSDEGVNMQDTVIICRVGGEM